MKPSNVSTGKVVQRLIVGMQDGPDPDAEPDFIAAKGVAIFTPSVAYLPDPTADPDPVTLLMKTRVIGVYDDEGYLCTRLEDGTAGERGVRLVANDNASLLVSEWTWNVAYKLDPVAGDALDLPPHAFFLLSDAIVDLTTVVKVPSSPGIGIEQAVGMLARAEYAALQAAESAAQAAETEAVTDHGVATILQNGQESGQVLLQVSQAAAELEGITGAAVVEGFLTITKGSGETFNAGYVQGEKGDTGEPIEDPNDPGFYLIGV